MATNYIKRLGTLFISSLLFNSYVHADDTEIYFQGGNTGVTPVVMFYIEYSPNLSSTICTGVTSSNIDTSCPTLSNLKLYLSQPTAANPTASDDFADGKIDQFEMTRAALKRVLIALGNMKIGVVTAHNADNNCAGPSVTGCSNGAEIFQSAVLLKKVSDIVANFDPLNATQVSTVLANDTNKAQLFRRLDRMRSPQGNFTAPNQNKEIYFELFRYLTGERVYNGHNGWNDFGTKLLDNGAYNLGDWSQVSNSGRYNCATGSTCTSASSGGTYIDAPKAGNSYKGNYNGDFIVSSGSGVTPVTYISSYAFKWDSAAEQLDGGLYEYISPIDADCQKLFMINVVDGGGASANDSDTAIKASYSAQGMNLNVSLNDQGFVEMVRWMYDSDLADGVINPDLNKQSKQNVISYFIAKQPQQVDAAALAGTGGATPALALTSDPQSVVDALNKIFNQILSVSTTFVAASIPVNVFNRSEVIDNAYIALFQANGSGSPQWVGDVKKLKLSIYQVQQPAGTDPVTGATLYKTVNMLQLVDAKNTPAIATDGRITQSALTYWTNPLGYDLYDNISSSAQEVAGDDGRSVNRGGAGEKIPGYLSSTQAIINGVSVYPSGPGSIYNDGTGIVTSTPRKLWTNNGSTLIPLDMSQADILWPLIFSKTDPTSPWKKATDYSLLTGSWSSDYSKIYGPPCFTYYYGAYIMAPSYYYSGSCWMGDELSNVIAFIRGLDTAAVAYTTSGAIDTGAATNDLRNKTRRWIMGDPLHSRPLPINYGARGSYTATNPDIRIVVGSNDGFLRMIRNTNTDGTESGKEVWAFMPADVLPIQKTLKDNIATSPAKHPYGIDGSPTVYEVDDNGIVGDVSTDKVWIFFGLRRGGRGYYAMDITNPDSPQLKWSINQNTPGFSELGYSFSQPVLRELDWGSGKKPVIIIGGGYDTNKDVSGLGTNDSVGNALFIIDADTGDLVWKAVRTASTGTSYVNADLVDSIPSDVTAYDSSGDGLVDRIYVGDTGGSVWRADLPSNSVSSWKITKVLNVGRHYSNTTTDDRRFFYAPDVVPAYDSSGLYDAVVIPSGNREHPLSTSTSDFVYMYKDRGITGIPTTFTTLTHSDLTDITHSNDCLLAGNCSPIPNLTNGWKLQLVETGEKGLASALTIRGVVYFDTYIPKTTSCGPNEGSGRLYEVALANGTAVHNFTTTNDVGGVVLGEKDRYRDLASGGIPSENVYVSFRQGDKTYTGVLTSDLNPGEDLGTQSFSTYWYEKQ